MGWISVGTTAEIIGLLGVCLYIGSYLVLQLGLLAGQSYTYALLNIAAASAVLFSLSASFNLSSAIIQVTWITISVIGILRLFLITLRARFTPEEESFRQSRLPDLPKHLALRFLRGGVWIDGEPGTVLTVEGEPVENLIYLARGSASVWLGDTRVADCADDRFIGELTSLTGAPATATVRLERPSRHFAIGTRRLRQLVRRNPDLQKALEASFTVDMRHKLALSNAAQSDRFLSRP